MPSATNTPARRVPTRFKPSDRSMELASFGPPADLYVSGASRTARRALEDPMTQISAALSDFDALADGATSLNASTNTSTSLTSSRMSSSSGPADVS